MKNKILILIIMIWIPAFAGMTRAQGSENITFRALNSSGVPLTGQASNITVKDLSGNPITCTVTEYGSQGNYIISFPSGTAWTLGKVYLNNVFQQFIGIHWVGDPQTIFPTLTGNNALSGNNIFSGSNSFGANISMSTDGGTHLNRITNLADPTNLQDAATKNWVTNNFSTNGGTHYIRNDQNQTYSYLLTFDGYSPWLIQYMGEGTGWRRFTGTANDTLMAAPKGYIDSLVFNYPSAQHLYNSNGVFDNTQFYLGSSRVHLTNPYSIDSNSMRKLNIYKDTTIGEVVSQRNWVIKRPFFSYEDSLTVKAYYYNSQISSNPLDSFYMINKAYTVIDAFKDVVLGTTSSSISSFSFPNGSAALWKVTITFEYLFDFGVNSGSNCLDSITVSFGGEALSVKYGYPSSGYAGMQGSATLQLLINTKGSLPDPNIYGQCSQNALASSTPIARKIKHLRVIAEIVN